MNKVEKGMIGFSINSGNWLSKIISFFTESKFSHSFLIFEDIFGEPSVIEASEKVQIVPFARNYIENPNEYFEIFKIKDGLVTEEDINKALLEVYNHESGDLYGFLQLPWFIWRWLCTKIGFDIKNEKNWSASGTICSKLVWTYLISLPPVISSLFSEFKEGNSVSPQDIYVCVQKNPEIFMYLSIKDI